MQLWTLVVLPIALLWPSLLWRMPHPVARVGNIPPSQRPLPSSLTGPFQPNTALQQARQVFKGVKKPETPVVLEDGTAYLASAATGQLVRSSIQDPSTRQHVAWLGEPLGMVMHPDGYLVVCDAAKGLLSVEPSSGAVSLLASRLPNASLAPADADIMFCDDVDASRRDGRIFFTDASRLPPQRAAHGEWDSLGAALLNALQGEAGGRLLEFDPRTRTARLLADGIWFANGVALSEDESYVLVVDTFGRRVLRYWLDGPSAGKTEVFVSALPGFPDGISRAPGGDSYWLAIIDVPSPLAERLPTSRLLRWAVAWLPDVLKPKPTFYGLVAEVSAQGNILRTLHDPTGARCHTVTSAVQQGRTLYLGSLGSSHVCALHLGAAAT